MVEAPTIDFAAIAAALGPGWTLAPDDPEGRRQTVKLEHSSGVDFFTWGPRQQGSAWRVSFHAGITDRALNEALRNTYIRSEERPTSEITVAANREPAAIARELSRRLLPACVWMLEKAKAANAAQTSARDTKESTVAGIMAALPGLRRHKDRESHDAWARVTLWRSHIDVEVSPGSVRFKIDTEGAQAVALAQCLASVFPEVAE